MIGADPEGVEPLLAQVEGGMDGIETLGRVDDEELWRRLHGADVLCAPSLGGESFGMVLTEAFAAGTPVVASEIAGYRQVVTHGRDGLLVPPGDPLELAEALRSLWLDPARRREMGAAARARAADFAWPQRRAAGRPRVYERAIEAPEPAGRAGDDARQGGPRAGRPDAAPPRPAAALARAAPRRAGARGPRGSGQRAPRRRSAVSAIVGVFLAFLALRRVGVDNVVTTLVHSSPIWVLIALGAVLDLDGPARGVVVPDRARRAAGVAGQETHDPERDLDRGADVRHAAGAAR